jgi:hypothetical protein
MVHKTILLVIGLMNRTRILLLPGEEVFDVAMEV